MAPATWALEKRRRRLSRHYEIVTEQRMEVLGHQPADQRKSLLYRSLRAIEAQFLPHYYGDPPRWRMLARQFGGTRTLPDFCLVGPCKAGTTDLAVSIMLHPNILPPIAKEFWAHGLQEWQTYYATEAERKKHTEAFGLSLSPYFMPSLHFMQVPYSLSRLKRNTKVVITLREPAERLFSHWKWELLLSGKGLARGLPFLSTFSAYVDKSLAVFPDFPMFTSCGLSGIAGSIYWEAVRYWIECFGSENVLVLDSGDYFRDRNQFLHTIQDFVGLPRMSLPANLKRINENPLPLPPPDAESMLKLRGFFRPYNEMLWVVMGKEFLW